MGYCDICKTAPGNQLPIYKNLRIAGERMFLTHSVGNKPYQCDLSIAKAQRAALHTLQLHIANLVGTIHKPAGTGGDCDDWNSLSDYLHKYCNLYTTSQSLKWVTYSRRLEI